jgi:hypothetical protein
MRISFLRRGILSYSKEECGNEIIYRSGHIHDIPWNGPTSDRAVIDGTNADRISGVSGVISLKNHNHIRIEGVKVQNASWSPYSGCISSDIASIGDIAIYDTILTGCSNGVYLRGDWFDDGDLPSNYVIADSHIYGNLSHGLFIRAGLYNVVVNNNTIHDNGPGPAPYMGDGLFFAPGGTAVPTHVTVRNNSIYDHVTKGHMVLWGIDDAVIEGNYFWEDDDYNRFGLSIAKATNVTVRNNVFVDSNDTKELEGQLRISTLGPVSNIRYYNNTIIGDSYGYGFHAAWSEHVPSDIHFKNNVFYLESVGAKDYIHFASGAITGLESDNNIFLNGDGRPFYHGGVAMTLEEWQGTGMDVNSSEGDPSLDSAHKPDSPDDPVVNGGEDLSYTGFSYDKNGTSRPLGQWDIGAYEYEPSLVIPADDEDIPADDEDIPASDEVTVEDEVDDDECAIARAAHAHGSGMIDEVRRLRQFRDRYLLTSSLGRKFVDTYYRYSPILADYISKHEYLSAATRCGLKLVVYIINFPKISFLMAGFVIVSILGARRIKS